MYTAKVNRESVFVCGGDTHNVLTRREESMRIMAMVQGAPPDMACFFFLRCQWNSIPEIFLFYIADFICAYPLFIKVT